MLSPETLLFCIGVPAEESEFDPVLQMARAEAECGLGDDLQPICSSLREPFDCASIKLRFESGAAARMRGDHGPGRDQ